MPGCAHVDDTCGLCIPSKIGKLSRLCLSIGARYISRHAEYPNVYRPPLGARTQGFQLFDFIRNHRRWMQLILLLLIVPSFVFVGAQGYSTFVSNEPEVATVGETPITSAEFENTRRNFIEEQRRRMGARFDVALVDTPIVRSQLLDDLINQRLLATVAQENRFSVSDEALRNTIASNPAVQDEGQFSPERYRQALAAQGLTPASYEASVRRDLAVQRVIAPVGGSARVPAAVTARLDTALTQTRTVQTRVFNARDYRDQVQVSDADIKAWYDANQAALEIPQYVDAQYLMLDEAAATAGVNVNEEQIAQYYEQNKSRFGQPERRRASHIMIEVPAGASEDVRRTARAKADDIAAKAKADPAKFAELARQNSQDAGSAANGGDLGFVNGGVLPPALLTAVNGLALDQVSGVVESPSGLHVLKLTELEAGKQQTLAEVHDQIKAEIRKQLAAERFAEMATKLTATVNDQRDSLDPAAQATGLTVRTAVGITRANLLPESQVGKDAASAGPDAQWLDNPRVRQALFSPEVIQEKNNAGVVELAADRLLAVRVGKVTPKRVPDLAVVSDRIRDTLIGERAAQAARAAGEALVKTLQADPASATAMEGFEPAEVVSRQDGGSLSQSALTAVLRMPIQPLPGFVGVAQGSDFLVARLEKVEAGKPDAAMAENLNRQATEIWGEAENRAVIQMLRDQYKVKVLPEAARAIEGEPAPAQS